MSSEGWLKRVTTDRLRDRLGDLVPDELPGALGTAGRAVTGKVGDAVSGVGDAVSGVGGAVSNVGGAVGGKVGGAVSGVGEDILEMLARVQPPHLPVSEPWSLGIGQLLSSHPRLPRPLAAVARQLDRFGQISVSPDGFGFDGDVVEWPQVKQLMTAPARDLLTSKALDQEVSRLTSTLPPVPGRRWLIRQVLDLLMGLCLLAGQADDALTKDTIFDTSLFEGSLDRQVPMTVTYKGRIRTKELSPGVFATLVMAWMPQVAQAICETAQTRGVTTVLAPPSRASRRADSMRSLASAVAARWPGGDDDGADGRDDVRDDVRADGRDDDRDDGRDPAR